MVKVNDLSFNVVEKGTGPAVLLLHGFPDSWYVWRHQIPTLADAGFRVIAPDQRGFGASDKPEEPGDYLMPTLVNDVMGIIDALGEKRVHVIGHDWGAMVGWMLAGIYPKRVERFVALSLGHPTKFTEFSVEQLEKSWYIFLFQFKDAAEKMLTKNDWALFRKWTRHHEETEKQKNELSRPGALRAGLNWYRANLAPETLPAMPLQVPDITVPTMGVWSDGDALLTEGQMKQSYEHITGPWRYDKVDHASHWLQLDQPETINQILIDYLKKTLFEHER
ncbi:alpha/beta fold hydrolase [Salicibibacter kimchii]|uniref:Alpha/beta hydrolase n=1 Tax=Salicibibacter kimchii TaxID=2099786 RepID=A0A345C1S7_9BACI|nr:alpha/beta hydrolase [Salicibibacter kimchii]AXF57158.1 alpha/beta hydrolase [Salicibibacter kimchii]